MAFIRATSPHRELLRDCSNVTERSLNEGEKMSFLLKHDELVAQKSSSSPSFIFLVFAPFFLRFAFSKLLTMGSRYSVLKIFGLIIDSSHIVNFGCL